MTRILKFTVGRVQAALAAALLSAVVLSAVSTGTAKAAQFCQNAAIPHVGTCHGPWASVGEVFGEFYKTGHGICLTLQRYSGGYYNVYEWKCSTGLDVYDFPRTEGYATAENPNSPTEVFGGEYF